VCTSNGSSGEGRQKRSQISVNIFPEMQSAAQGDDNFPVEQALDNSFLL